MVRDCLGAQGAFEDLLSRLVDHEVVGRDLSRHDALAEAEVRVDHGLVEVVRDRVQRKADACNLARELLLDYDRVPRRVDVEPMLRLVDQHALGQARGEARADRRLEALRGNAETRDVATRKGRSLEVFVRGR